MSYAEWLAYFDASDMSDVADSPKFKEIVEALTSDGETVISYSFANKEFFVLSTNGLFIFDFMESHSKDYPVCVVAAMTFPIRK